MAYILEHAWNFLFENEQDRDKVREYLLQEYTCSDFDLSKSAGCFLYNYNIPAFCISNDDLTSFTLTKNDGSLELDPSDWEEHFDAFLADLEKGSGVDSIGCIVAQGNSCDNEYFGKFINIFSKGKLDFYRPSGWYKGMNYYDDFDMPTLVWENEYGQGNFCSYAEYEPTLTFLWFKNKKTGEKIRGPWCFIKDVMSVYKPNKDEFSYSVCLEHDEPYYTCDVDEVLKNDTYKIETLHQYFHEEIMEEMEEQGKLEEFLNTPELWKFNPDDWEMTTNSGD